MLSHILIALVCSCNPDPAFARSLEHAVQQAATQQVSAELLLAVARHESRLDPTARGKAGEVGLWQLHPRYRWGREVLEHCPSYWENECLLEQAEWAAYVLGDNLRRCGTLPGALSAYNTGSCDSPVGLKYAKRVLRGLRIVQRYASAVEGGCDE